MKLLLLVASLIYESVYMKLFLFQKSIKAGNEKDPFPSVLR